MPIRQGGILAKRVSTWPRDHFCRSTIAPRSSRPTTWNEFLPISMPIADHGNRAVEFLGHGVLLVFGTPRQHHASFASGAGARPVPARLAAIPAGESPANRGVQSLL